MSFWELCQMLFGSWLAFVVLGIPAAILKAFLESMCRKPGIR